MKRFVSMDPLGFVDSMNLFEAFGSDPVNMVDPLGLKLSDLELDTLLEGNPIGRTLNASELQQIKSTWTYKMSSVVGGDAWARYAIEEKRHRQGDAGVNALRDAVNKAPAQLVYAAAEGTVETAVGMGRGIIEPFARLHDVGQAVLSDSPNYISLAAEKRRLNLPVVRMYMTQRLIAE